MSWECPFCGGVPMWKDGAKSYCAKCNKIYNDKGSQEKLMEVEDAHTCKDVKI